jgi:hypothetical protein
MTSPSSPPPWIFLVPRVPSDSWADPGAGVWWCVLPQVAQYCQEIGDFRGAIEFLLMAQRSEEAFTLAKSQNQVETYAKVLGDHITPDEARNVAHYYETRQDLGKAGRFYSLCGQYARALKLFLQVRGAGSRTVVFFCFFCFLFYLVGGLRISVQD